MRRLNFPSPAATRHATSVIEATGLPAMFVAGNHDWQHYPNTLEGSPDALRLEWCEKALGPFYSSGKDPMQFYEDRAGLRFIAIDNSTNAVTCEQLDFFRTAAASAAPEAACGQRFGPRSASMSIGEVSKFCKFRVRGHPRPRRRSASTTRPGDESQQVPGSCCGQRVRH